MATINFKGKTTIWNHHLSVPYQTLDKVEELSYNADKANGNLIVEGDNLIALKSLLPTYQGKVKCIYIDPPYNTGNEGWIYNDKVNSPMIKEWLGKEVGEDDLTRHDKWLCMMTPRLKLLKEFLLDDGLIFISIDDKELSRLVLLMNEIFGEYNHVTTICWEKRFTRSNNAKLFASSKEYIVVFRNSEKLENIKEARTERNDSIYSNPDNDPRGVWTSVSYVNPATKNQRPNLVYKITNPQTNEVIEHPTNAWKYEYSKYEAHVKENKLYWGVKGENRYPRLKKFLFEMNKGIVPTDLWNHEDSGTTDEGTRDLEQLFKLKVFDNPKPTRLIKRIISLVCSDEDIILDSFAGSGTTAQAVLELNEEDEGNRKFILVQMKEDSETEPNKNVCKDITSERIKRVIEQKLDNKYGFEYKRLGKLIDPEAMLEGDLPTYKEFAKYVYYLATGKSHDNEGEISEENYFVGSDGSLHIYLIYKQDYETLQTLALTLDIANEIKAKYNGHRKIVYAPTCYMDEEYLKEFNIQFVSIPYNLFERIQK